MIYERFVCFDLSKQIRRSTLRYKVFILFPLKNYPFTGCKRKFGFAFEFDFEKSERGITLRGASVSVFGFRYFIFEVSDLTIQFLSLAYTQFYMRWYLKCENVKCGN